MTTPTKLTSPPNPAVLREVQSHRSRKSFAFLRKGLCKIIGPGIITGASDDDPSGVATYSQAGAVFGLPFLWTTLFSIPFMTAIQELSARIGRVTGRGIAANIRKFYSKWLLYPLVLLLIFANVINLAADVRAMGEALRLLVGGPVILFTCAFALLSVLLQIFVPYSKYANVLRIFALALLGYVATAFFGHFRWHDALYYTFVPHIQLSAAYLAMFIAVIGTTITPYLFFWQAALETEEIQACPDDEPLQKDHTQAREQFMRIRFDTNLGMILSNVIAFFIMLTTAAAVNLNPAVPIKNLQSAQQAAEALRPTAGNLAFFLFSLGIIGVGLLAIPSLAGSAAYAVGEAFQWRTGMDQKPKNAKRFYAVIALATALGAAMNFLPSFDPIKALVWAAVINGIVAVPMMATIMVMAYSEKVMGKFALVSKTLRLLGWAATLIMAAASLGMFILWWK